MKTDCLHLYSYVSPLTSAYLPYLNLSDTGVESVQLPQLDDGISGQIDIEDGLPFGNYHPIAVWVCTATVEPLVWTLTRQISVLISRVSLLRNL